MKRRISIEQLQELTEEQLYKLRDLWNPKRGDFYEHNGNETLVVWDFRENKEFCFPLLDIGQMIEILTNHCSNEYPHFLIDSATQFVRVKLYQPPYTITEPHEEMCDCLWEAVKTLL